MKSSIQLVLVSVLGVANVVNGATCDADDCARAVTGTANAARATTVKRDCSSFLRQTVLKAISTSTVTVTVTSSGAQSRDSSSSKTVPPYASACSGAVRYSSACSCFGVVAETTTVTSSIVTVTQSTTVLPTGSASGSGDPPASTFRPTAPATYDGCILDPQSSAEFELLDAKSAIPIVNNNGLASLATQVIDNLDPYRFSKPSNAPAGLYDIVLQSNGKTLYYAVFANGKVGFTSASSNGQAYITASNGDKYVTTVFAVACNGEVTAGIIGGPEFQFDIVNNNVVVKNAPASARRRRDVPVPKGFYVLPKNPPAPSGTSDRCLSPSQNAVSKNPAPPPSANGCGTATGVGSLVPELDFSSCCNGHDYCFGNCGSTFDSCNSAFLRCNLDTCRKVYPGGGLKAWACEKEAKLYGYAVTGSIGKKAFASATSEYCDCKCKDTTLTACGPNCVNTMTDPKNCGDCNFFCPSGACTNGACSFDSCKGQTCGTFSGSCGPGGSCVCASITDATGFCVDGRTPCSGLPGCSSSTDCALGSVCAVNTCCGENVCIATDSCGGKKKSPQLMMDKRSWSNRTIASLGDWVD